MLLFDYSAPLDTRLLQGVLAEHWPQAAEQLHAIEIHWKNSVNARVGRMTLSYAEPVDAAWPHSLFVKQCKHQSHWLKASEYLYYTRDYLQLAEAPLPRCYGAALADNGDYLLLLHDLSYTHLDNKEHPPDAQHVKAVAIELARLHAFSSLHSPPHMLVQQYQKQLDAYFRHMYRVAKNFLSWANDELPVVEIQQAHQLMQDLPERLAERAQNPIGLTMIHGDANPSNVLSPRESSPGSSCAYATKTYLIDRQPFVWSLCHGPGVFDLAYMAVPYWAEHDRQRYEKQLLKNYWQALCDFGLENYTWEACLQDYRLCVQQSLCVALSWGENKKAFDSMRWLWQKQWARSQRALEDWDSEAEL